MPIRWLKFFFCLLLLCCLPMLILPTKRALNTKDPDVIIATLRALQQLVQADRWRKALKLDFAVFPRIHLPCGGDEGGVLDDFFLFTARCHGPWVGPALVPYYRQLLPVMNMFKPVNCNIGGHIDFQGGHRLGDVINETLMVLERTGGKDAYLNIKYMVPTYESCVHNR
ncbi:conserved hypothetical protein [Culex quinquefasciatus]|uniref:Uncharacterized protein n=1 Tax=Culex quinquefasciatus TaxID=7176 RepID=B0XDB7_CULQU|nr:conserved hypothetical protein [Culex quinquefasciatus]|eukprot:XP_001867638.1 conserved hypothetical protein [Culex quinquefasciatus]